MIRWLLPWVMAVPLFASPCPTTPEAWQAWVSARAAALKNGSFSRGAIREVAGQLAECPQQPECVTRLRRFTEVVMANDKKGHSMGLPMSDVEYHDTALPGMLDLPPELKDLQFLRWLDENTAESKAKALKYVDDLKKGWIAFLYDSQHLPPPDGSWALGRFFVYVPGKEYDQFLQFATQQEPGGRRPDSVSIVSIEKSNPPRGRLTDLWRTRQNGKIEITTRLKKTGGLENCYECHKQVLLPITPNPASFDSVAFGEKLKEVNAKMKAFGPVAGDGVDPEAHGPGIGEPKRPGRTAAFFDSCAAPEGVSSERYDTLAKAMSCAGCHNGEARGALNYPSALRRMPDGPPLSYFYLVTHKKMPPGWNLSDQERKALAACLKKEHYGDALPEWLRHTECWKH